MHVGCGSCLIILEHHLTEDQTLAFADILPLLLSEKFVGVVRRLQVLKCNHLVSGQRLALHQQCEDLQDEIIFQAFAQLSDDV